MNILNNYKEKQKKSEFKSFDLNYYAIGLGGEVGEVLNEIKKLHRDDKDNLSEYRKQNIISELGDCMWYIQGICNKLDISLEEVINKNIIKISKISE